MLGLSTLDKYLLRMSLGTLGSVIALVMSLMVLEHLPRLIDITNLSGHRGYIVGQTVLGLLPEYAGIGAVFGLFLALALTVRKLALRNELDAIEAMGIAPVKWLRTLLALSAIVAGFVFVNQGWLMPAGEHRIDAIGRRMMAGDFGYNLSAKEFHELGDGIVLRFDGIDAVDGGLTGIFVRTDAGTFQASSGRLGLSNDREGILELRAGQLVETTGRVMSFSAIAVRLPATAPPELGSAEDAGLRSEPLDTLLKSGDPVGLRIALARLLWVILTLLAPVMAVSLGRPPMRSTSALGIFLGLCIIVALIKTIDWYAGLASGHPVPQAALLAALWTAVACFLANRGRTFRLPSLAKIAEEIRSPPLARRWWVPARLPAAYRPPDLRDSR